MIIGFLGLPVIYFYIDIILIFMGIDNYIYLKSFFNIIYISLLFFTLMKVKFTIITFFYESIFYLKLAIFQTFTSLGFFSFICTN